MKHGLLVLALGILLLWTMPPDPGPGRYLHVKLCARIEGSPDSIILGVMDSLSPGSPCSSWVNVGCIPSPQRWTFWAIPRDSAGNWAKDRGNLVASFFLP